MTLLLSLTISAQEKRAWELGVGGSVFQFNRVGYTHFNTLEEANNLGIQLQHVVVSPHIYIARELNPYLYLDFQGDIGFTEQYVNGQNKTRNLYKTGLGLQYRLGEYFESKYIDPFFRIGINYLYKNFDIRYVGTEGEPSSEMSWVMENIYNKNGVDKNTLIPIQAGVGVNGWLNDNFGIGLQADYLYMPYKDVANSLQGTVRLIWRIGGKSKKPIVPIEYVEVPVEVESKIVYRVVEVERDCEEAICDLFENVYFEFDKSIIKPESNKTLDKIASIINANSHLKFLITGHTDIRGSNEYNDNLSKNRASAVVNALKDRGVNSNIIKSRGVGKRISFAPYGETHEVREGDRKVTVEVISNSLYWDLLP